MGDRSLSLAMAPSESQYGSLPGGAPRREAAKPWWAVSVVLVLVGVMASCMLLGRMASQLFEPVGQPAYTEELYMTSTQADRDRLERYRVLGVLRALTPDKGAYKKAKAMAIKKLQEFQKDDAKTMGFVHKPFDATGHKKLEAKLLVELNKNATTLEKSEQQELAKKQAKQLEMIKTFP